MPSERSNSSEACNTEEAIDMGSTEPLATKSQGVTLAFQNVCYSVTVDTSTSMLPCKSRRIEKKVQLPFLDMNVFFLHTHTHIFTASMPSVDIAQCVWKSGAWSTACYYGCHWIRKDICI